MKKKLSLFALILLLALPLCIPAMAGVDYGVIYDETEQLGSPTLTQQGEETLPQLSETLGIDLRVDVLTMIDDNTIGEAAKWIYEAYGYGYGEHKEGATLTILMEPLDTGGYAMRSSGDWCIYTSLQQGRGNSQDLADAIRNAVEPCMAERAWNGEDLTMSAVALTQAVEAMAEAATDYILTNCPPDGSGGDTGAKTPETQPETDPGPAEDAGGAMEYVFDLSGLLTYQQWEELEYRAESISQHQRCGVYFAMVDDYTDYGDGGVYEVTYQLYHKSRLGVGEGRDGIIVLLSMEDRDYAMFVYGEYAEYAFDAFGQEELEGRFLGNFADDDWYGGISHYLDACDEFLTQAEEGDPVRQPYLIWILIGVGIACVAAGSVCAKHLRGMKSVRQKAEANAYVTPAGLHLTQKRDQFSHTTVTRTKIQKGGSSGSTRRESGGGGSGRSGKF